MPNGTTWARILAAGCARGPAARARLGGGERARRGRRGVAGTADARDGRHHDPAEADDTARRTCPVREAHGRGRLRSRGRRARARRGGVARGRREPEHVLAHRAVLAILQDGRRPRARRRPPRSRPAGGRRQLHAGRSGGDPDRQLAAPGRSPASLPRRRSPPVPPSPSRDAPDGTWWSGSPRCRRRAPARWPRYASARPETRRIAFGRGDGAARRLGSRRLARRARLQPVRTEARPRSDARGGRGGARGRGHVLRHGGRLRLRGERAVHRRGARPSAARTSCSGRSSDRTHRSQARAGRAITCAARSRRRSSGSGRT